MSTSIVEINELATLIREQHNYAQVAQRESVGHAIRCGDLLVQAKKKVGHGAWTEWLKANVKLSETTARGYMRLAGLDDGKRQRVADLSLREALKGIANQTRKQQRIEHGAVIEFTKQRASAGRPTQAVVDVEYVETRQPDPPLSKSVGVIDDERDARADDAPHDPSKLPKKLPPPSNGLHFARIALINLDQIRNDDLEHDAALDAVFAYVEKRKAAR